MEPPILPRPAFPIPTRALRGRPGLGWLAAACLILPAAAQLPATRLMTVFPPVLVAGSTQEVVVSGEALEEPVELFFSEPGLSASPKPGSPFTFLVTAPAGVAFGPYDVRAAGRFGASNPRAMAVVSKPVARSATALSWEKAQPLGPGEWVVGRAEPKASIWFRGTAAPGVGLSVEMVTDSLDSKLDPVLTVYDAERRPIAHRRGPWVDFVTPRDGEFRVAVRDETYQGGDAHPFLLRWSAAPRIEMAVPSALRRGATNQVRFFGRRLPGGRPGAVRSADGGLLEEVDASIVAPHAGRPGAGAGRLRPSGCSLEIHDGSLEGPGGVSAPWPFLLVDDPTYGLAGDVLHMKPPAVVGGLFPGRAGTNSVQWDAKKGRSLWVEVFCDRLGFGANPTGQIERLTTNGQGVLEAREILQLSQRGRPFDDRDFPDPGRDLAARFEAPEDGRYQLRLRDAFAPGPERPRRPFVVRIAAESRPGLAVMPSPPPKAKDDDRQIYAASTVLRRGETVAVRLLAMRGGGLDGDAEIVCEGLPPGVSAAPLKIPSGQKTGLLLLTAAADAPAGRSGLHVRARFGDPSSGETPGAPVTVTWPAGNYDEEPVFVRRTQEIVVSVAAAEPAPVTLTGPGTVEAALGSKVKVEWEVERRSEWAANPKLKLFGDPACDKFPEVELDAKATNLTTEINLAEVKLSEGRHWLWLRAPVTVKYRDRPEAVTEAEEELKRASAAEAAATGDAKKAAADRRKAAEDRKKAAEERAKARDLQWNLYSRPFALDVRK